MKYYSEKIPYDLAKELFDRGMTMKTKGIFGPLTKFILMHSDNWDNKFCIPTYGEVFDWFLERKKTAIVISIFPYTKYWDQFSKFDFSSENMINWVACVNNVKIDCSFRGWTLNANAAIKKAIELL